MLASAIPTKIQVPFATTGDKVAIPVPSQIGIVDGRASWTTGFVPLNGAPLSAGGVAPFETDFNGIFNQITAIQQWQCAGAGFTYDATFATEIGGYPKGARIVSTSGLFMWLSLVDNNLTDPNGGSSSGWVLSTPGSNTGAGTLSTSRTLTVSDIGAVLRSSAALTYTLPMPSSLGLLTGNMVTVVGVSGAAVSVVPAAGVILSYNVTTSGIVVGSGQSVTFVVTGSANWQIVNSTAEMGRNTDFSALIGANGWKRSPGGVIEQWGTILGATVMSPFTPNLSFPINFPTACRAISVQCMNPNSLAGYSGRVTNVSASGAWVSNSNGTLAVNDVLTWQAIGD